MTRGHEGDHAVDLVPAVPGALGNVDLHFCQATCKREQMAREDDLHLHVLGLEVNSKVEGAEQLLVPIGGGVWGRRAPSSWLTLRL